jgi:hypothetical protein
MVGLTYIEPAPSAAQKSAKITSMANQKPKTLPALANLRDNN